MPGLPIIFRAIRVGFSEPTTIYQIVEKKNGKWEMLPEVEMKQATMEDIARYLQDYAIAPHKPIVVPDDMPQIREELRRKGIRAK